MLILAHRIFLVASPVKETDSHTHTLAGCRGNSGFYNSHMPQGARFRKTQARSGCASASHETCHAGRPHDSSRDLSHLLQWRGHVPSVLPNDLCDNHLWIGIHPTPCPFPCHQPTTRTTHSQIRTRTGCGLLYSPTHMRLCIYFRRTHENR